MRFRQVAVVLASGALSGCSPAGSYSGVLPAANASPFVTEAMLASLAKTGCRTRPRKVGTSGATMVTICAIAGAHTQAGDLAPSTGIIMATLKNVGTAPDDRWKLAPGRTYYVRVFGSGTPGVPGRYDISSFTNGTWDNPQKTGVFVACTGPKHPKQSRSHAGYATCDDPQPADAEDPAVPTVSQNPSGGPAWIACAEGCCTTDPQ